MGKNIGKNIRKNLSSKYSQKILDRVKQSPTDAFKKPSKRAIQKKKVEATVELISNEIPNVLAESCDRKIMAVSKNPQQNRLETVTNENYQDIPKERHISHVERHEIIDELILN